VVEIVPIKVSNPEVVQETLEKVLSQTTTGGQRTSSSGQSGARPTGGPTPDDIRRRMEFLQRLREGGAFGRPGGGPGGAFGGRPPFGGLRPSGGTPSGRGGSGRGGRGR
jgi:translation initiation factor IF-2